MKKARLFWIAAWSMQAIAWFVRVERNGVVFPDHLPGWEAWWVSTDIVLHMTAPDPPPWFSVVLSAVSSVSTVLFLFVSPAIFFCKKHSFLRKCAWISLVCWILNGHWMFLFASDWVELRIGYYLWWISFGALSAALFAQASEHKPEPLSKAKSAAA